MKRTKQYLLMQLTFARGEEYDYGNCGIKKDSQYYKPKIVEKFSLDDNEYIDYLVELINKNNSVKGRKYDTMLYLVEGSFYYGKDKKKFMDRNYQESLMEDFFDTEEYIIALGKSKVLKNVKPEKLKNNVHVKYSNIVQPHHFTSLGIYRLDPLVLDVLNDSIDYISSYGISELNESTNELEACLKPRDSKAILKALKTYNEAQAKLFEELTILVSKLDEEGFYR